MPDLAPELQTFVSQAEAALGRPLHILEAFTFGDSPGMADELATLVLAGQKTATCGWPPSPEIVAGTYSLMLDGRGAPLAVIESMEVRQLPFLEVEAQFAFDEGDRSLAWWRDEHRQFFRRQPDGARWSDAEVVQCERFRVVWSAR